MNKDMMIVKSSMISFTVCEEVYLIIIKGLNYWKTRMRHINWEKTYIQHNFVTVYLLYAYLFWIQCLIYSSNNFAM